MKRNVHLQDLSRDHHYGLLLGWKIRQGLKKQVPAAVIKDYVDYFFQYALLPHFKEEEDILLSRLPDDSELKEKTLAEHSLIARTVADISLNKREADLLLLADMLDSHIRYEERTLFPYLEQYLTEAQLRELGEELQRHHHSIADDYPDEFWK